jgi:integrase
MSKRHNGEGTFTQRKNGTWQARLSYIDDDGVSHRLSFYGRTQTEAARKLREARKRIEAGDPAKDAAVTVARWCDMWCATTLEASSRKPTTKALMRTLIGSHIKTAKIGAVPLAKLRPSHVDAWVLELRSKTRTMDGIAVRALSDSTVQRVFRVLRVVIDGAVRDKLLAVNPVAKVEQPAAERHEARVLAPAEVAAILTQAKAMDNERKAGESATHWHALFATIAATGLRKGEALALRWDDVDLPAGTIAVRGTLSRVAGALIVTTPKTRSSRRVLAPSEGVMRMLRAHRLAQLEDRMRAGSVWAGSGHVFASAAGTPIDPRNVLRSFTAACARANVSGATVHTLRHSAATAMLDDGVHLKAVSQLLGHAGTQITADTYAHLTASTARKAMDGLGVALGL